MPSSQLACQRALANEIKHKKRLLINVLTLIDSLELYFGSEGGN